MALIGGAGMGLSVLISWLAYPSLGYTVTGWDTYRLAAGSERWFTPHAFSTDGFSPGFTGMPALIAAGLLMLSGVLMLLSLRGGSFRLGTMTIVGLRVLALLVVVVGVTGLISSYATGGTRLVTPQWGLFQLAAGAVIGVVAVWMGLSRGRT